MVSGDVAAARSCIADCLPKQGWTKKSKPAFSVQHIIFNHSYIVAEMLCLWGIQMVLNLGVHPGADSLQ